MLYLVIIITSHIQGQDVSDIPTVDINELLSETNNSSDTIYIINFWATWCAPCVAEIPEFNKIKTSYKNHPIRVIMANLDFENLREKNILSFLEKNIVTHPSVLLNTPRGDKWINNVHSEWSGAIPATLTICKGKKNFHEGSLDYLKITKLMDDLFIR